MAPTNWLELVLNLAREGDTTADARKQLLDEQVRESMDGMAQETQRKFEDDRRRGVLKRSA